MKGSACKRGNNGNEMEKGYRGGVSQSPGRRNGLLGRSPQIFQSDLISGVMAKKYSEYKGGLGPGMFLRGGGKKISVAVLAIMMGRPSELQTNLQKLRLRGEQQYKSPETVWLGLTAIHQCLI